MQMKGSPTTTTVGVFSIQPQPIQQRNAVVIQNKCDRTQDMEVQRADIPDLIKALQTAYYEQL